MARNIESNMYKSVGTEYYQYEDELHFHRAFS